MQRHAGLVWQVCRRHLDDDADLEDAFQATFVVLLQKGPSLQCERSLASWLHAVAYRVALKARARALRRHRRERQVENLNSVAAAELPDDVRELRALIDQEMDTMPEKYRLPLVLCYLQGKTNEQAARELGWPVGSISKKLAQGRQLLRTRLQRRGVVYTIPLAAWITAEARAAPPTTLVTLTPEALTNSVPGDNVTQLAQGVLKNMAFQRLKLWAGVAVVIGLVALGASLLAMANSDTVLLVPAPVAPEIARAQQLYPASPTWEVDKDARWPLLTVACISETREKEPDNPAQAVVKGSVLLEPPATDKPISMLVVSPPRMFGETFKPVALFRRGNEFKLICNTWTHDVDTPVKNPTREVSLLKLSSAPLGKGDYEIKLVLRQLHRQVASSIYYQPLEERTATLSFRVPGADAAPAKGVLPMLEEKDLASSPVRPADRVVQQQFPINGNYYRLPLDPKRPERRVTAGTIEREQLPEQSDGRTDAPSLAQPVKAGQPSFVAVLCPPLHLSSERTSVESITWQGLRATIKVTVWRNREHRGQDQLKQPLHVIDLKPPPRAVTEPNAPMAGEYEILVEWTYLRAQPNCQAYDWEATKLDRTKLKIE
ncbi:MAG: RNA polymerase sigma factor [Gemmataceae bacterium]